MTDKPIIVDGVDVSKCYRYSRKTGYCEGAFKLEELPLCENFDCDYKRCKLAEQNAQDIYDMFKACLQSLEIARKQLSDEQQKLYQIGKICEEWKANDSTNAGVQLMIGEIINIIGGKTNE